MIRNYQLRCILFGEFGACRLRDFRPLHRITYRAVTSRARKVLLPFRKFQLPSQI